MARLLAPLGSLYGAITAQRMSQRGTRAAVPVLCIGNFVVGGAGKTPTAIAIARMLKARGEKPVFLSRGYGGKIGSTPRLVDATRDTAQDVGDEPLLLARAAPTVVGSDRVASARLAVEVGASLIILDDGLQNPSLIQDWRLAVIDGSTGIGNGLCLPAGPLRAPLFSQLATVSAILFVGDGALVEALGEVAKAFAKPVSTARLVPDQDIAQRLRGQRVFAFAGIGLPDKFRATLEELGATLAGWRSFADHHVYTKDELQRLHCDALQRQALLVTTEKDFIRIAPSLTALRAGAPLLALPVKLVFNDEDAMEVHLIKAVQAARAALKPGLHSH